MFIGHFAPAFVAAAYPKAPKLGTLFVAAQLVDIGFFSFVPLGIEAMRITPGIAVMNPLDLYHMPWTHSLIGAFVWGAVFAVVLRFVIGNWTAALIGGVVVVSHWFVDLLVHVPDLTIAGSPPKLGLGLWNHPAIAMPLEIGLIVASAFIYARATRRTGSPFAFPALIAILFALQAFNWFGPAPVAADIGLWGLGLVAFALAAALASWVASGRVAR